MRRLFSKQTGSVRDRLTAAERRRDLPAGLHAAGQLVTLLGLSLLVPAVVGLLNGEYRAVIAFAVTGLVTAGAGVLTASHYPRGPIGWRSALFLCVGAWLVYSLIGGIPVCLTLGTSFIDACFEAASGFTTTGLTLLTGIEYLPRAVLFWRVAMQWFGGLGILSYFLFVSFPGGEAYRLLMVEGHKTLVQRPAPGMRGTLIILWRIYLGLTIINFMALLILKVEPFSALTYALSTSSTGGFGMHDANIAHFQQIGHPNALAIEIVTMVCMLLSGIGFLSHHLLLTGRPRHCVFGPETRTYWALFLGAALILVLEGLGRTPYSFGEILRPAIFQSASLTSGAGLATVNLGHWLVLPAGMQVLFLLMLIGGCTGSTAGGLKILRVRTLRLFACHQVKRATYPSRYRMPFTLGGQVIPDEEVTRMLMLAFHWVLITAVGSAITSLLSPHGALESFSMSLSAVSNMGPSLISPAEMAQFPVVLKLLYIGLMIAGRLEILPVLALFTKRMWQR